jgi:hypothetical protein
MTNADAV